jgi:hypothetical protein
MAEARADDQHEVDVRILGTAYPRHEQDGGRGCENIRRWQPEWSEADQTWLGIPEGASNATQAVWR